MAPTKLESSHNLPTQEINAASSPVGIPVPTHLEKKRDESKRRQASFQQACQESASHLVHADAENLALWWSIGQKICEILGCTDPCNDPLTERDNAIATYGAQTIGSVAEQLDISWEEAFFNFNLFRNCDKKTISRMCDASLQAHMELFPRRSLAALLQDPEADRNCFQQVISSVIQAERPLKYSRKRPALDENTDQANRPVNKAKRKLSHMITNCDRLNKAHQPILDAIQAISGASEESPKDYARATSVASDLSEKVQETIENLVIVKEALDNLVFEDDFSINEHEVAVDSQA